MTPPNVFLVPRDTVQEDRFTAHWHYLLDNCSDVAQGVVDLIAERAGLPAARWVGAEDHSPTISNHADKPDFLITTSEWQLICEHKLDSALGTKQLERYLALCDHEPHRHVALFTNRSVDIDPSVLSDPRYAKPLDGPRQYFMWEDFYHIILACPARLSQEFAAYMESEWMHPVATGPLGDPYVDPGPFRGVIKHALPRLKKQARVVKGDKVSAGLSMSEPAIPGVSLLWAGFSKVVPKAARAEMCKPFYVQTFRPIPSEEDAGEAVERPTGRLWSAVVESRGKMNREPCLVRTYVIAREIVLLSDAQRAVDALTGIIEKVFREEQLTVSPLKR